MTITGKFEHRYELHLVHSIDQGIRGERRLEIWRPGIERILTPAAPFLDKIEPTYWGHPQLEQEVSGLSGAPNSRTKRLSPCELPCSRDGTRASHLLIDLPERQELVSSCLWLTVRGDELRKPAYLVTAPAYLMK